MVVVSLYNHAQGYIYYDNRARLKKLVYVGSNLYNFKVYVYAMYEAPSGLTARANALFGFAYCRYAYVFDVCIHKLSNIDHRVPPKLSKLTTSISLRKGRRTKN